MVNARISVLLCLFGLVVLSGCTTKGGATSAGAAASDQSTSSSENITGQALGSDDTQAGSGTALTENGEIADRNTIYFEYNSSELGEEDKALVNKHASFLLNNPKANVVLEGHADERGSREYNMALGEKRAHSIKQLLELKGVSKHQIKTVSFGEEKPEIEGHGESSWSKNRRAVFSFASN